MIMYSEKTQIYCNRDIWTFPSISMLFVKRFVNDSNESIAVAEPMLFKKVEEHGVRHPPTIELRIDEATALMDDLWRCGIRPSNGDGSVGEIAAVRNHLADMQKLVFDGRRNGKA